MSINVNRKKKKSHWAEKSNSVALGEQVWRRLEARQHRLLSRLLSASGSPHLPTLAATTGSTQAKMLPSTSTAEPQLWSLKEKAVFLTPFSSSSCSLRNNSKHFKG